MTKIGYARVSTKDQKLDLQINALNTAGCEKIYEEYESGRKCNRPQLKKLFRTIKDGDTLVVWKIDRLGRSARDICNIIEKLREKNVTLISLNDGINTSTSVGRFTMQILGSLAEIEVSHLSERTKEGLEAARKRGAKLGRPPGPSRTGVLEKIKTLKSQSFLDKEIMQSLNIPKATYYRYKRLTNR